MVKDAEETLNISGINKCLSGKRRNSGGFIWRYKMRCKPPLKIIDMIGKTFGRLTVIGFSRDVKSGKRNRNNGWRFNTERKYR